MVRSAGLSLSLLLAVMASAAPKQKPAEENKPSPLDYERVINRTAQQLIDKGHVTVAPAFMTNTRTGKKGYVVQSPHIQGLEVTYTAIDSGTGTFSGHGRYTFPVTKTSYIYRTKDGQLAQVQAERPPKGITVLRRQLRAHALHIEHELKPQISVLLAVRYRGKDAHKVFTVRDVKR